jgi:hypothetical protein
VASAESSATRVTAASPAAVLSESWMRSKSEHCGKRQRGKELRGSTRMMSGAMISHTVGEWRAMASRVHKKARSMSAIDRAGKCDAGKLAFDCAVF